MFIAVCMCIYTGGNNTSRHHTWQKQYMDGKKLEKSWTKKRKKTITSWKNTGTGTNSPSPSQNPGGNASTVTVLVSVPVLMLVLAMILVLVLILVMELNRYCQ